MTETTSPMRQFPCPNCSADLEFNPDLNQLLCPYCGTTQEIKHTSLAPVPEQKYTDFLDEQHTQIAALSKTAMEATCPGCHASITFEPPEVAGTCPFCATNIVAQAHTANPIITPGGVLPFQFGRKHAQQKIRGWLNKLWFEPSGLKKMAQHQKLQGVYLPFWTYDSETVNRYRGERGTYYYVDVKYSTTDSQGKRVMRTRREQRTKWRSVSGTVTQPFDDVLVAATTAVDTARLNDLGPWNLAELVPYKPSYLAGLKAQRYQVNMKQGFEIAKTSMESSIRSAVCQDIGGDTQRIHQIQTSYGKTTFKHILLPVWMGAYRFKNKPYQVMINAQSGKLLGDRPWSVIKISGTAVAAASIILLVAFGGRIIDKFRDFTEPSPDQPTPTTVNPSIPAPQPVSPQPSSTLPPQSSSFSQTDAAFQQAMNLELQAIKQAQTAQSAQEWQQVANLWIQAIELLKQVPSSNSNSAIALQKIQEYQNNLNDARQRASQ